MRLKQIDERERLDQEAFERSFFNSASAVLGKSAAVHMSDERIITKAAIDSILKYYHLKPVEIPSSVKKPEDQVEYSLRPYGLMNRDVKLTEGWYKDAYGTLLGKMKDSGVPVALIPGAVKGYWFTGPSIGRTVKLNKNTEKLIAQEAFCFYKPLPQKKLRIIDLLIFMKNCVTKNDVIAIVFGTLMVTLMGLLMPRFTKVLAGPVLVNGSLRMLISIAVCMVSISLASQILTRVSGVLTARLQVKTSTAMEAAVMMRILALPASFFGKYNPAELNSRSSSIGRLSSMMLGMVMNTGLSSLTSLLYITQIFAFAPSLVVPSVLLILASAAVGVISSYIRKPHLVATVLNQAAIFRYDQKAMISML